MELGKIYMKMIKFHIINFIVLLCTFAIFAVTYSMFLGIGWLMWAPGIILMFILWLLFIIAIKILLVDRILANINFKYCYSVYLNIKSDTINKDEIIDIKENFKTVDLKLISKYLRLVIFDILLKKSKEKDLPLKSILSIEFLKDCCIIYGLKNRSDFVYKDFMKGVNTVFEKTDFIKSVNKMSHKNIFISVIIFCICFIFLMITSRILFLEIITSVILSFFVAIVIKKAFLNAYTAIKVIYLYTKENEEDEVLQTNNLLSYSKAYKEVYELENDEYISMFGYKTLFNKLDEKIPLTDEGNLN